MAFLADRSYASLADICARFDISESTARRDLDGAEQLGLVRRTRGGALYLGQREHPLDYQQREGRCAAEKDRIGQLAADLVFDGDVVILDGGTTTYQVARRLRNRSVKVVTNSLPIASLLGSCPETEVTFLGGYIMPQTGVALGRFAEHMLSSLSARLALLGTAGITADGLFNSHLLMVELERLMMHAADEVVILADHTKFDRKSLAKLCELDQIDHVVTDADLDAEWHSRLSAAGVRAHVAQGEIATMNHGESK